MADNEKRTITLHDAIKRNLPRRTGEYQEFIGNIHVQQNPYEELDLGENIDAAIEEVSAEFRIKQD
jgi:hypothetical protein